MLLHIGFIYLCLFGLVYLLAYRNNCHLKYGSCCGMLFKNNYKFIFA